MRQPPAADRGAMLVFDGDCGFCTSCANWVACAWSEDAGAQAKAWQVLGTERLADVGLSVELAKSQVWWVEPGGKLFGGDQAIGKALATCRGWRHWAGAMVLAPPVSWVAPPVYRLVARYRYKMPGGTPACRLD